MRETSLIFNLFGGVLSKKKRANRVRHPSKIVKIILFFYGRNSQTAWESRKKMPRDPHGIRRVQDAEDTQNSQIA